MITRIEAKNFRCLHFINQQMGSFHVLIGPNASGKTTFLDVIAFLGRMMADGPEAAVTERTNDFKDLVWKHECDWFELAVEASIPEQKRKELKRDFATFRYEVRIGIDREIQTVGILDEKAWLQQSPEKPSAPSQRELFPMEPQAPESILTGKAKTKWQRVLTKAHGGNDNFYVEVRDSGGGKGWFPSIRLGPRKSALANLPEDEYKFPVSTWFKRMLIEGVQQFALNSLLMRKPSPPNQGKKLKSDGSNLPWIIHELEQPGNKSRLKMWVEHVRTSLPEIESIRTVEIPDNRFRYLLLRYQSGLEIPSWMASDGTLRFLALTIPAYIPEFSGICLIEEPENGIHPQAVETVFKSLTSVYGAQVLLATHSPVILSIADVDKVLCFKKTESGATDIVRGDQHPALKDWRGDVNLGTLFAGGVLG
jgi:predicted ATPase